MASARSQGARPRVVVVGLGPAGPELTTPRATAALEAAPVVMLRTSRHPAAAPLVAAGARSLDVHYEAASSFEQTYGAIVEDVVAAAIEHGLVAYAVPGSPLVLESSVALLCRDERVEVELVAGMSFLDLAWERLGVDPVAARARLVDAERFARDAAGDTGPLLVSHLWSRPLLSEIKLAVESFPDEPVVVLHHLGLDDERIETLDWADLDRSFEPDHLTCLWVPSLASPVAAELVALDELVHTLREACPWDAEQTHESLARHLLEEAYETLEAIDELSAASTAENSVPEGDPGGGDALFAAAEHLEEELGDVLCQVLYHSVLAAEEGHFSLADVARNVHDKLVGRHPHVFGGAVADSAGAVVERWEQLKQREKGRSSITEGIPSALPALARSAKLERKAASVKLGVEATGPSAGALRDVLEEVLAGTASPERLGALLLGLARLGAREGIEAEEALRRSATAFSEQLRASEEAAARSGIALAALDGATRRALWREAAPG